MRGNARSLGKVDGNKLLSVVLEGLKNSPQFKMPFLKRGAFLTSILENKDSMETLRRLVCLFAEEYQLFLEFFRPFRTTDNNLLPSIFFKRSRVTAHSFGKQQQASSCSLANKRCIIEGLRSKRAFKRNPYIPRKRTLKSS